MMLQSNHSLARPCPSCGAPLRVHSGRLNQKMQCPKCLDTIVMDPAAAKVPSPEPATRTTASSRTKRTAPPPVEPQMTQRYAELLAEHAELAERYADVVADYDSLVATHAELTMRLHALSDPG